MSIYDYSNDSLEGKTANMSDVINWNYTKYLIDREGNVLKRYEHTIEPADISKDLEGLL